MDSSNNKKVIKASSIRIARKLPPETSSGPETARHGAKSTRFFDADQNTSPAVDRRQSDIERETEHIRQGAYERGMAEGLIKGAAEQKQALAPLENSLAGLIHEMTKVRKEFLSRIESDVLNLVFAIAEKILNHEITIDRDVVCKVLGSALSKMVDKEGMKIRVNPEDYSYLKAMTESPFPGLGEVKDVMLEADAAIGRGGVVIVSVFGEIDARLDQQMSILKDALSGR
jgi:flagellar assembly protein FliH